jgi:hypothetical protein
LKNKVPSKFLRDAEAVAAALGLVLPKPWQKKAAALQPVHALLKRKDFPARQKPGWLRADVLAFALEHVVVAKNGREFVFHESKAVAATRKSAANQKPEKPDKSAAFSRTQPQQSALPPQPHPAGEGDLFITLTPEQMLNGRLDLLQEKYFHPERHPESKIAQWEVNELRAHRPWLWHKDDGGVPAPGDIPFPKHCTGLDRLCNYYKAKFKDFNIKVRKQTIEHWQNGRAIPASAPFHPVYDSAGRYDLAECFAWFEKWQLPKYKRARTPELAGIAETESIPLDELRDQDEREEIEYRKWERNKDRGEYVHKTVALATGIAAVKKLHLLVKAEDERNLPKQRRDKLAALGVPAEVLAAFEAWDIELGRTVTDRRELAMQEAGTAMVKSEKPKAVAVV